MLLVVGFVLKVPAAVLWATSGALVVCGCLLAWLAPVRALLLLPLPALIGPITRISAGDAGVHLGDVFLYATAGVVLLRSLPERRFRLGSYAAPLGILTGLVALSALFSVDVRASAVALIGIGQLALVYVLTLTLVRSEREIEELWHAWIAAVTISSLLVLVSYARGQPLLPGLDAENYAQYLLSGEGVLRATFFVTGFVFPLAVVITAAYTWMIAGQLGGFQRALLGAAVVVNSICLFAMNNKTAMAAAALGLAVAALFGMAVRGGLRRAMVLALLTYSLLRAAAGYVRELLPGNQFMFLMERIYSTGSLVERFPVWRNVVEHALESPRVLLLGLGPEVSIRRLDHPVLQRVLLGNGIAQGAVDNGYLYVLLNYGLLVLMLGCAIVAHAFGRAATLVLAGASAARIALLSGLAVWLTMAVTQQHAVAKPVLLLVQMVALTQLHDTRLRFSGGVGRAQGRAPGPQAGTVAG